MVIHVCQLAPTLLAQETQGKIGDFNEHLRSLCESNHTHIINSDPAFRLGTGEIEDMCFDMESDSPGSTLNRLGIIRLFNTINKQFPHINMFKNIDSIKKITLQKHKTNQQVGKVNHMPILNNSINQQRQREDWNITSTSRFSDMTGPARHQTPNTWTTHAKEIT